MSDMPSMTNIAFITVHVNEFEGHASAHVDPLARAKPRDYSVFKFVIIWERNDPSAKLDDEVLDLLVLRSLSVSGCALTP